MGRRVKKLVTTPSALGVALRAYYFSQPLLGGGTPTSEEIGSLDTTLATASAEWVGTLRVPTSGTWTLKLDESAGNGYRLWLDGVVKLSTWPAASVDGGQTITVSLEAGKDYGLRIDASGAGALARLKWSGPGTAEQAVPSAWDPASTSDVVSSTRFAYDGWNLLAELDDTSAATGTYVWGLDLGGGLQSAGGVGGLLFAAVSLPSVALNTPSFDGNGNVIGLVDMVTGVKSATYDYNAFGEAIQRDGVSNHFRFSTKFADDETGLLYYGYRIYQPSTGRWLSRDPSDEKDNEPNLFAFVSNSPANTYDPLGLWNVHGHYDIIERWLTADSPSLPEGSTYTHYRWHCYYLNVEQALKNGNDEIDGTGDYGSNFGTAQASENSYQHAMRGHGETVEQARMRMQAFIAQEVEAGNAEASLARSLVANNSGNAQAVEDFVVTHMTSAIHHIGRAQHPVADATSPLHAGFQEWNGWLRPSALVHHLVENDKLYESLGAQPAMFVRGMMDPSLSAVLAP